MFCDLEMHSGALGRRTIGMAKMSTQRNDCLRDGLMWIRIDPANHMVRQIYWTTRISDRRYEVYNFFSWSMLRRRSAPEWTSKWQKSITRKTRMTKNFGIFRKFLIFHDFSDFFENFSKIFDFFMIFMIFHDFHDFFMIFS